MVCAQLFSVLSPSHRLICKVLAHKQCGPLPGLIHTPPPHSRGIAGDEGRGHLRVRCALLAARYALIALNFFSGLLLLT